MKVRKLRLLRRKHAISYAELGKTCRLSPQRISEIELSERRLEPETEMKIKNGISELIRQRRNALAVLQVDYQRDRDRLFDFVEVSKDEL